MLSSQTTGYTRMLPVCTGGSPGHQRHGPDGLSSGQPGHEFSGTGPPGMAWAVPGLTTPGTAPNSNTAVASPTNSRFMARSLRPARASTGDGKVSVSLLEDPWNLSRLAGRSLEKCANWGGSSLLTGERGVRARTEPTQKE